MVAPCESPDDAAAAAEVVEVEPDVVADCAPVPVPVDVVCVLDLELEVDVLMSDASYTIRTPRALIPSGFVKATIVVLVIPLLLRVKGSEVGLPDAGVHVQKSVDHMFDIVLVSTHHKEMSLLYVGQHVTVVTVDTPFVSWHAR